jgi:uncharacterized metal-binding protein YceD (DUF177 family)
LGKLKEYDVDLASLTEGHHEEDYHIGKEFFELMDNTEIQGADVDVHMDIEKRHGSYECRFHCEGTMEVPCDRCLDPVSHEVDTDYDVVVRYGEEYDDSGDNLLILPYSANRLNVAGIIYDTLLLTIPLRCVHAEGECNPEMAEALREHNSSADYDEEEEEPETDME